jgi:urease accessory protein
MAAVETAVARPGTWHGSLALRFAPRPGRTALTAKRHEGPFLIQRPFYPGDGACHVYLLHPPAGLAGGDELALDVTIESDAHVLLTTPASTKFYRSDSTPSVQRQHLRVAAGASLEWLPLDTILFGGSRARLDTSIELEAGARFIGWETLCLGRPFSGDHYATGVLDQHTEVTVAGEAQLIDTLRWRAGDRLLAADWGLAGFGVCGAVYAYPADTHLLALVRELLGAVAPSHATGTQAADGALRCGATLLGELLVVRCLAHEPEVVRTLFERIWETLRPSVTGRNPCAPRVWRT